jgi:hypothetical protein
MAEQRAILRTTSDYRNGSLGLGIETFAFPCSAKNNQ